MTTCLSACVPERQPMHPVVDHGPITCMLCAPPCSHVFDCPRPFITNRGVFGATSAQLLLQRAHSSSSNCSSTAVVRASILCSAVHVLVLWRVPVHGCVCLGACGVAASRCSALCLSVHAAWGLLCATPTCMLSRLTQQGAAAVAGVPPRPAAAGPPGGRLPTTATAAAELQARQTEHALRWRCCFR